MQALWQKLNESPDLFAYWHNELALRKEFRNTFTLNQPVTIENREQIDFLYRCLYLTGKYEIFWSTLISNLDKSPALNWVKEADYELIEDFFNFMPKYILDYRPTTEQLLFLVHIYNKELSGFFVPIINLLTAVQCEFILNKTAQQDLRSLLKQRLTKIEKEQKQVFYGLDFTKNSLTYPTMHGDKVKLLADTLTLLHKKQLTHKTDDYDDMLPIASYLFDSGLVEDCLQLLILIYKYYDDNKLSAGFNPGETWLKTFNKLVLKTISMYALLNTSSPLSFTMQMYNCYFAQLSYDIASLTYLKLYEKIQTASRSFTAAILDLYQEVLKIQQMRPDEIPLLFDYEITSGLSGERFLEICRLAKNKLTSLPHEAFITMELLRNLLSHNLVRELINKDILAANYLHLFKWLPNSFIINETITADLIANTSPVLREQLEKTLKLISHYSNFDILTDIKEKPDLFKLKNEDLRRVILTGKFLGGLK